MFEFLKILKSWKEPVKVKLDYGSFMPIRAHANDAGADLRAVYDTVIQPNDSVSVDTGVHVEIPKNCAAFVKSKSGLMVNLDVVTDGTIDEQYRGSIRVKLFNHGKDAVSIRRGDKIAQICIVPVLYSDFRRVSVLSDTERGNGGFGSTGR